MRCKRCPGYFWSTDACFQQHRE